MIRRPPRSTLDRSSAASDVYKRQGQILLIYFSGVLIYGVLALLIAVPLGALGAQQFSMSLIHISEPTRPY